jgi:hypothetical protein
MEPTYDPYQFQQYPYQQDPYGNSNGINNGKTSDPEETKKKK